MFSNNIICLSFFLLLTGAASNAIAQDNPGNGMVYNSNDVSSITYFCNENLTGELECEFNQVSVRKKAQLSDLDADINKFLNYQDEISAETCQEQQIINDVLKGKRQAPKEGEKFFKNLSNLEREHTRELTDLILKYCTTRDKGDLKKIFQYTYIKDTRTCKVSTNTFKQKFKFIKGSEEDSGTWVVIDSPSGVCGMINLSRFEPDNSIDTSHPYWNYIARRAITNPNADFLSGTSCKAFEQNESLYSWRLKEYTTECDYIEFSVF